MSRLRLPWYSHLRRQKRSLRTSHQERQTVVVKTSPATLGLVLLLSAAHPIVPVDASEQLHLIGKAFDPAQGWTAAPTSPQGQPADRQAADASVAADAQERQLEAIVEERDRARTLARELERELASAGDVLDLVLQERDFLRDRLKELEGRLLEVVDQREAERRVEVDLRWKVARLQNQLTLVSSHREQTQLWLKDWLLGSVEALEQLFDGTGVDVEELVARAADSEVGQGGPLQAADIDPLPPTMDPVALPDPMGDDMQRLAALQRLARSLPLVAPIEDFELTSGFGRRKDPFTGQLAFHPGLDFGAPRGTKVMAAAPGRVIQAGPVGEYGNLVELDHGMGVITRYAHLKTIAVGVGEEVATHQVIGVIGSTGRSTARHLHYEIWVDDRAHDPAKFLDAGRYLVGVFGLAELNQATRPAN
jgi:murein DD-endopeptidase MepM/ murein hydrolase activator NlpD